MGGVANRAGHLFRAMVAEVPFVDALNTMLDPSLPLTVGEYEVVILSAEDSMGLDTWLRREKYKIPEGAEPAMRRVRSR